MNNIGKIVVKEFVITTGSKKGKWQQIVACVEQLDDEFNYMMQLGSTHMVAINPQGEVLPWHHAPTGAEYSRCYQFIGQRNVETTADAVEKMSYNDYNFNELKRLIA
jgi:hypothetical protein